MGITGIAMGFAPNIGPTIGGWMIGFAGWRSFFVALFVCALVLLLLAAVLIARRPQANSSARLDVLSLLLSALGFGGLLLGFSNASSFGLASPYIWVPAILGALFLVLYLRRQKHVEHPLTNLQHLRFVALPRELLGGKRIVRQLYGHYADNSAVY